jgi:MoCo/4Fe-4S cofactor protein with predicted Tat translocation signal
MSNSPEKLDLASVRARLEGSTGKRFWRSLEELAQTDNFSDLLHREFPRFASEWDENDVEGRRTFMKVMAASLALAGLTACTKQPTELIMPYVRAPEELVPGKPLFFATAMPLSGAVSPLLVESHEGRPTKIEGNPEHPAAMGAADVMAQASILGLYDPDRSQTLTFQGEIRPWAAFLGSLREALVAQAEKQGAGIRLLTQAISSPTLAAQIQDLLGMYPSAKWIQWEPVHFGAAHVGSQMAFGAPVNSLYRFEAADVVLALDADFLCCGPASLRYSRDFMARRRVRAGNTDMNRLYAVECTPTLTGAKADHRLPLKPSQIENFARAIAAAVGVAGVAGQVSGEQAKWVSAVARDLQAHRGSSLVVPGEYQTAAVHSLAHAMNAALGNTGKTVVYTDTLESRPADHIAQMRELVSDLQSGAVDMLVIAGGNPVFTAPADLGFKDHIAKAKLRIHLGLYDDETAELCQWHIPEAHYLEAWSDGRAYDGTVSIMQPLIAPLYRGRSAHEFIAAFSENPEQSGYDAIRSYWQKRSGATNFDLWWRKVVHDGFVPNTALPVRNVSAGTKAAVVPPTTLAPGGLEIVFRPDPYIYDGRFANNAWLQELPRPLTRLTWDNGVIVGPRTAERLQLQTRDEVELEYQGRKVRGGIWILPGQPEETVTVHLGFGRTRAGRVAGGPGFNAYAIRTSNAPWSASGARLNKTGGTWKLVTTQDHWAMEGREIVISAPVEEYRKNPDFVRERNEAPPAALSLYPEWKYEGNAWGMGIDQTACIGCNACVVACQAENNIPVVGKEQVANHRAMHWIRVDRYYEGSLDNPRTHFQPLPCMQCEYAPCEVVCPVQATSHSQEGLNDMVYNRCVGTRYCQNNCPYKVRRFNFLLYQDWTDPSLAMQRNPDVTVRSRGVMEKCTYCVQRITHARIEAEKENRPIRDGEVVTACQATCPTDAIVFGNLNDPKSRVRNMKADKLNYGLLAELNTRPRTTYLASLRNPNPELEA